MYSLIHNPCYYRSPSEKIIKIFLIFNPEEKHERNISNQLSKQRSKQKKARFSSKCQEAYCSRVERIYRGGKRSLGDLHDPSVARPVAMGPVTPTRPYKHRSSLPLCFAPGRATYLREDKFLSERRAASPYRRIM